MRAVNDLRGGPHDRRRDEGQPRSSRARTSPSASARLGGREGDVREGQIDESGKPIVPTLGQVAEEFGIASGLLRARAGREQWRLGREQHVLYRQRVRQAERARDAAVQSFSVDLAAIEAAGVGLRAVRERLEELDATVDGQRGRQFVAELRDLARLGNEFLNLSVAARGGPVVSR